LRLNIIKVSEIICIIEENWEEKMKMKRKKYGIFLGAMAILFLVSTLVYKGTLVDEKKAEMEGRQNEQEEEINEDFALVTAEGHPAYYGSTKEAHSVWGKAGKGKVIFADSYDKYSDKTIIAMDGYSQGEKNEMIRGFEIYFENFSTPMSITLEDALKIANGYIPYEIISEWYEFNGSYCIQPVNSDDEKETYYVVSYRLTESGSDAYYADEHVYSGSIEVIFEVNKAGNVNYFTVGFGTPRWMFSLNTNGYEKTEWNYDFCTQ